MKIAYTKQRFNNSSRELLTVIGSILAEYAGQGFVLTVRQLYYQLVARAVIKNNLLEYRRITSLLNDARLAGLVDWDAIEDRTRSFIKRGSWDSAAEIVSACARQFHMDMWEGQKQRVYVLVEKEALVGVLERVCHKYDIPLLAARGYPSVSVLHDFALHTLKPVVEGGQRPLILHLGDHDPSGIDMTRDLQDRLNLFLARYGDSIHVKRIALNMPQIEELNPPENPAKTSDSRFKSYMEKFGRSSWELDALQPAFIAKLVEDETKAVIQKTKWKAREQEIEDNKTKLLEAADNLAE